MNGNNGTMTSKEPVDDSFDSNGIFLATAGESRSRASVVLPNGPSEDASHILGAPPIPPQKYTKEEDRDYGPNEAVEWVLELVFSAETALGRIEIESAFSSSWLEQHGSPTLYGLDAGARRWTYVHSRDAPETYAGLQLGWDFNELNAEDAESYLAATRRLGEYLSATSVDSSVSPSQAEARAWILDDLVEEAEIEVSITVVAPDGQQFEGRALWDCLTSLGLQWGDCDLFHWENPSDEAGDDHLFSVGTSTEPGYFFPEDAAAGQMKVDDLDFGFTVGRTVQPMRVFEAMLRAAQYVQRRLGGEVVGADGPLDEDAIRDDIEKVVERMMSAEMPPGSSSALRLL